MNFYYLCTVLAALLVSLGALGNSDVIGKLESIGFKNITATPVELIAEGEVTHTFQVSAFVFRTSEAQQEVLKERFGIENLYESKAQSRYQDVQRIFNQCGVSISNFTIYELDVPKDNWLRPFRSASGELRDITAFEDSGEDDRTNNTDYISRRILQALPDSHQIIAIHVPDFWQSDVIGFADLWGPTKNTVWLSSFILQPHENESYRTEAHELAHVLLGPLGENEYGPTYHDNSAPNLLAAGHGSHQSLQTDKILDTHCDKMKTSTFVRSKN